MSSAPFGPVLRAARWPPRRRARSPLASRGARFPESSSRRNSARSPNHRRFHNGGRLRNGRRFPPPPVQPVGNEFIAGLRTAWSSLAIHRGPFFGRYLLKSGEVFLEIVA